MLHGTPLVLHTKPNPQVIRMDYFQLNAKKITLKEYCCLHKKKKKHSHTGFPYILQHPRHETTFKLLIHNGGHIKDYVVEATLFRFV